MDNRQEIESINVQIAFLSALVFSVSIGLYALFGYKDILINGSSSRFSKKYLYDLGLLSACISLIVTIYFFILSYDRYKSDESSQENYDYYMASVLSLLAQSIRVNTILKNPYDETLEAEDII